MDRAGLIEQQMFQPEFARKNDADYVPIQYWERFGARDKTTRSFAMPLYAARALERVAPSLRPLNVSRSRYHAPGGLTYYKVDREGVLNSSAKVRDDEMNNTVIEANPGIWEGWNNVSMG